MENFERVLAKMKGRTNTINHFEKEASSDPVIIRELENARASMHWAVEILNTTDLDHHWFFEQDTIFHEWHVGRVAYPSTGRSWLIPLDVPNIYGEYPEEE
ncbi:hypothetical protein [Acetonema longum]|uniref:hypothetical protein n=1 Tax=Acetonema longum TaxID=2374 RepID=UPI0002ED77AA|nr:hypothetical protein [Acetonema longum]